MPVLNTFSPGLNISQYNSYSPGLKRPPLLDWKGLCVINCSSPGLNIQALCSILSTRTVGRAIICWNYRRAKAAIQIQSSERDPRQCRAAQVRPGQGFLLWGRCAAKCARNSTTPYAWNLYQLAAIYVCFSRCTYKMSTHNTSTLCINVYSQNNNSIIGYSQNVNSINVYSQNDNSINVYSQNVNSMNVYTVKTSTL